MGLFNPGPFVTPNPDHFGWALIGDFVMQERQIGPPTVGDAPSAFPNPPVADLEFDLPTPNLTDEHFHHGYDLVVEWHLTSPNHDARDLHWPRFDAFGPPGSAVLVNSGSPNWQAEYVWDPAEDVHWKTSQWNVGTGLGTLPTPDQVSATSYTYLGEVVDSLHVYAWLGAGYWPSDPGNPDFVFPPPSGFIRVYEMWGLPQTVPGPPPCPRPSWPYPDPYVAAGQGPSGTMRSGGAAQR